MAGARTLHAARRTRSAQRRPRRGVQLCGLLSRSMPTAHASRAKASHSQPPPRISSAGEARPHTAPDEAATSRRARQYRRAAL
eukprot:scaffold28807_cov67-Phaeocystis_antarctica.AAC.17